MAVYTVGLVIMCSEEKDISRQKNWTLTYQVMSHTDTDRYRDIPTFDKPVEKSEGIRGNPTLIQYND